MSRPEGPVTTADVVAARDRIAGRVLRTPVIPSWELHRRTGREVSLKLENLQPTGSFKVRGATSRIVALSAARRARGVVTASTGNHGRAVAHVAAALGMRATVCVSSQVPPGKVGALEALGCEVVVGGGSQHDALVTADALASEHGMTFVHPFDDPLVVAGQATIGLELLDQVPDMSSVLVPLSGGGLLAGIAIAVKRARPEVRIVGVSMERAPAMAASLRAGRPVELPEERTLADSLQGGIGGEDALPFRLVRMLMDDVVLVGEQAIWDGMRLAFDHHGLVLEGAAAVGVAAVLAGGIPGGGRGPVVVVCSGGNVEAEHLHALAQGLSSPPQHASSA